MRLGIRILLGVILCVPLAAIATPAGIHEEHTRSVVGQALFACQAAFHGRRQ